MDPEVVTDIIKNISEDFGELTVTNGNKHTFLGMKMNFRKDQKVELDLSEYLREAIVESGMDVSQKVSSPAANWLFKVNENAEKLSDGKRDIFHSVTQKLLWVTQRGRPDCGLAVSFLVKRVHSPDVDDWKKLRRLLCYINHTINDTRVFGADNLNHLDTFIDSSHAVHMNMRGHTGGAMSMGTGIVHGKGSAQKMNSRSSTETELIGNSEYLPYSIWVEHFMEAQGHKIKQHVLWQDNESAEKMAKNGRLSCMGNSRHVAIKFFWTADRVKQGKMDVKHCPTAKMLADFYTKPLQGKLFQKFRRVIMGWDHISILEVDGLTSSTSSTSDVKEERVGNRKMVSFSTDPKLSYADVVKSHNSYISRDKGNENCKVELEAKAYNST